MPHSTRDRPRPRAHRSRLFPLQNPVLTDPIAERLFLTYAEAAQYAGLPQSHIRRLVDDGKLEALRTGIEKVCRNRMLEHMEVALVLGNFGNLAVTLHEDIEHLAADGFAAVARKENGGVVTTASQVRFDGFDFIGLQGMLAAMTAFQAIEAEAEAREVEIGTSQVADFTGP